MSDLDRAFKQAFDDDEPTGFGSGRATSIAPARVQTPRRSHIGFIQPEVTQYAAA